jgi:hypothetical protein
MYHAFENVKGKDQLGNLHMDARIILKQISNKKV